MVNTTPDPALNYEERGKGVPVVLAHGFPFDHTIWQQQLEDVSKVARVLAPDLPGFGKSEALGDAEPTIVDYADQLALWAKQIGLDRLVLVGHSMGGYIALAFAGKYADMLAGLGLVCTRPGPDSEQAKRTRYTQIDEVWQRGPQVIVDAMLPKLFSPETKEKKPRIVQDAQELMLRQKASGIVSALQAMATRPDSSPLLEKIEVPTLVVSGADDALIPQVDVDLMAATISGARQERIDGAGHLPMMERPDKLSDMLRDLARGSRTDPNVPEPPPTQDIAGARTRK